ncbi:mucin-17-like isoform X2 [Argopecten irradians]|uniref:mucin-17-like isoform X2 n=1 Tax=Argopecten irradians TaxID=31199 RepID=UPI0037213022
MDFSALSSELQNIAGRYNGRDTDPAYSTTMYCEMFHKILQKTETEVHDYADQIVILWMTLSQLCNTANTLAPCPARDELYQDIFLQCAKTVLNIKWQNLAEDDQSKENFIETVKATHVQLVTTGFDRFTLLLHLMENPWTDPTLSEIMSGEADNEKDAVQEYVRKESSLILKLRVEMLMQENCEEFALNLCNTLMGHEVFVKDIELRETQLKLLHKLNHMDKLQEVCEKIVCHDGVKLVLKLEQKECNQALSVRLIQIFLVQDWIKPEQKCCTQELLKLWIRHQYIADHNKEKFLDSVWAIAKLSLSTQQILLLVSGLQRECGNEMIQLYTDLCVYAINVDKGCCEQQMLQGNMDGVKDRQQAIAQTCRKLSALYNGLNPKISRISSLTAFSLDASLVNLCLVERMFNRKYCTHSKKECAACIKVFSSVTHCVGDVKINPATLYEVERLLNMLRPYYLNPDLAWKELLPVCQKFMKERSQATVEAKDETSPPKTPKKKESKPRQKKSTKKEMSVSPGNIKYYCDDNVSYLPKESAPKAKNKNFRLKSAPSSNSCTQTPKPEETKTKQSPVKAAAAASSKSGALFEHDKQLFQYNFKGKSSDRSGPILASSTITKEQVSAAGSELPNNFINNLQKTATQVSSVKCQAVGVDSKGKPVLLKVPITANPALSSTVSGHVLAQGASRQPNMYIADAAIALQASSAGLQISGQGKVQKPKKRQPHSIGELLEATKVMPCSTSSNYNTAAMTITKPAVQQSLPTSADLLRAARDYNLTVMQKPVAPKPFQTQYSTADLLRATKNIPQKSKQEVPTPSNLQSAKDMVQATKAAFAASVLGFIPKSQAAILSDVSQGITQTLEHASVLPSEKKPPKKPRAPKKSKNITISPAQLQQASNISEQFNSVQTTSNRTVIAHSYKTVDGSISFLSSNMVGSANIIPSIVNPSQAVPPVRPPTNLQQTNDKSNHRPRIIPVRTTCNSKFAPYSTSVVAASSTAPSPGQIVGANMVVTTSQNPSNQTQVDQDFYNMYTKEKPVTKQPSTASKIEGFRRPSADELQSIVDWLQTGTEDDKKKAPVNSPVSSLSTQQVVTSVPSTVQSVTLPSVVTPIVTSSSPIVTSPTATASKPVSLTPEQLQKIMAGLSQRQKIKQKTHPAQKNQQKKGLSKQIQQLMANELNKGNNSAAESGNNFVQQNPLLTDTQTVQPLVGQLSQPLTTNETQFSSTSVTNVSDLVQQSLTRGNQPVQQLTTSDRQHVQQSMVQVGQIFPLTTPVGQLVQQSPTTVQPPVTQVVQLIQTSTGNGSSLQSLSQNQNQSSLTEQQLSLELMLQKSLSQENQSIQPSSSLGNQLNQPSPAQGNQPMHSTPTLGNQQIQQSSYDRIQLIQPSLGQGNQPIQSTLALRNQLIQPTSSQGNQPVQPTSALANQLIQPMSAPTNQLFQPTSALANQLIQPTQQSSSNKIQLIRPKSSQGNQPIIPTPSLGQKSSSHKIQLIPPSSQGNRPNQPPSSHGNQQSSFGNQPIPPLLADGNQQSQPYLSHPSQVSPLTHGNQPSEMVHSQSFQQSQSMELVTGNPTQNSTHVLHAGNQLVQTSQAQQTSDACSTSAPALTLPISLQVTASQSLPSMDQLANTIQTTASLGTQPSLSFTTPFQITGSKTLMLNSKAVELQYLGQFNPPSKILHPKPLSKDGPSTPSTSLSVSKDGPSTHSTSLSVDPLAHLGKTLELSLETSSKSSELPGLKQPTFIPKTLSSEEEINIPKMPLGTLKVVEKPNLISTLKNPAKLSIDHVPSTAHVGSVTTSNGNQQGVSSELIVSSSSDNDVPSTTEESKTSPQTENITTVQESCNTKLSAQPTTFSSPAGSETTSKDMPSTRQIVKDVSESLSTPTLCDIQSNSAVVDSKPISQSTTSESNISSSSEINKDHGDAGLPSPNSSYIDETKCDGHQSVKESDASSEVVDRSISPDSTSLVRDSAEDSISSSTVIDICLTRVHNEADNSDEKTDKISEGGNVLNSMLDTVHVHVHQTQNGILTTTAGDNLTGQMTPTSEVTAIHNISELSQKPEFETVSSSCLDEDTNEQLNVVNSQLDLPAPDTLEEITTLNEKGVKNISDKAGDASNTSEMSQSFALETDEKTNSLSIISSFGTEQTEKVSISGIVTTKDENLMVPTCVPDEDGSVSISKESEETEVSKSEQNSGGCVKANEDCSNNTEDNLDNAVTLGDASGKSTAILSAPAVELGDEPSQGQEQNSTPELNSSSSDVKQSSIEESDMNVENANTVESTPELKLDSELYNSQATDIIPVTTMPLSQDVPQMVKPPEQDKEAPQDHLNKQVDVKDLDSEKKEYSSRDNSYAVEKDTLPQKDWENAFVSFIDNLGEKKMVKTDNTKVSGRPVFSRQDSSGSESSSRSVASSLSSRGSHKSSLDEDSSGTRILPLQRRDNDVKRFEYFSNATSSHKSSKKRPSKSLATIQIHALPEIKAKVKSTVRLVPATTPVESTDPPQPKEVANKCMICAKTFRSVESLKCHVRNICRPLDASRPEANLKDFEYKTLYLCRKCEKEYSMKEDIKTHVAECCKDDDVIQALSFSVKYMCQMCGEYFTNKDDVHSHVSRLCSKVMSCRQQQQERLDRKTELTAKPLSDMVENLFSKEQKHLEENLKEENSKEKVQKEVTEPVKNEEEQTLGVDDLDSEIFSEAKSKSKADEERTNESDSNIEHTEVKSAKHHESSRSLPVKQWSLRNKTKSSSRLKGFEYFSNKLNPARRRADQRKWHEDYHSLRNRVVKKEAEKDEEEDKEEEDSVEKFLTQQKSSKAAARDVSETQKEVFSDNAVIETKEKLDSNNVIASKSNQVKSEKKEINNKEVHNHSVTKSKVTDMAKDDTMDPPIRQKRVIQVGRKFLQDEFEVPEFLKMQVANTNLKRKSPQHCPKCGQFFSSSYVLIQHVVRVHMSPCKSKWNSTARKFQFACWYCPDAFPTYIKFSKHVPVHKDKILAMLKRSCSTSRQLRRHGTVMNNLSVKTEKTSIDKTKKSNKTVSANKKESTPLKETEILSQHVESMRTSRRARGQPPLATDMSELKVDTGKKERSQSREKDLISVSGILPSSGSLSPGMMDLRTTRSRRRDNDSMSTSSFDRDDDLASNCSHATDKSSLSKGKNNKRGLSEDRESMTSEDSVSHRPVTRHQLASNVSPTLKEGQSAAKKLKKFSGSNVEPEKAQRTRTRSGNVLSAKAGPKVNDADQMTLDRNKTENKPTNKMASSVSKGDTNKSLTTPVTRNQSKAESDSKKSFSDSVSQLRNSKKEAKTDSKELSVKEDNGVTSSSMTTRRSTRLNDSSGNVIDNCRRRTAVVKLHDAMRHRNNEEHKSFENKRKMVMKSKQEEKEQKKIRLAENEGKYFDSKNCDEKEDTVETKESSVENQKSVLVLSEEDEEFVYVKSPLSSPSVTPVGKEKTNSATLAGKAAFLDSFKKYIHKPGHHPNSNSFHLKVAKSKLKQRVCRTQAKLVQKRRRENVNSSRLSSEDEADDELDEDVNNSNKNSNKKKSFLDTFIDHCDNGPRLKGYYDEEPAVIKPTESTTKKSKLEAVLKGKKTSGSERKNQAPQPDKVKTDVISKPEKIIANTEMSLSV